MKQPGELAREIEALRERLSRLSEASLRINESLDFETVLQGVLDSACVLTGARYGVLAPFDETGDIQAEGALNYGATPAEVGTFWEMMVGSEYCDFFEQLPGPTRLADLQGHFASLGFPGFSLPLPINSPISFLGVVIRYAGESFGAIYLAGTESGGEFTVEDEETLVMFASQAALVIANARRYQDEQKARADLETLINTSLVGVVVFDARTGSMLSFNQECQRIAGDLMDPGQSLADLLQVLLVRRGDGSEIFLGDLPLAQAMRFGETVRAEEIVISVPDGRSVTMLMNATPIRSEEGEVETFVVTVQDMTPLEEMERLRAEFLGMVSHELRTPLTSIKGSTTVLMDDSTNLGFPEMRQFHRIIDDQADHMIGLINDLLDVAHIETGTLPVSPEPAEVPLLVDQARSRFLSSGGRSNLHIDLAEGLPLVMADRRRVVQVLTNLLSNAARHSPEASPIRVTALREGVHVSFSVADEGRGIPGERLPHLFRKFSRFDAEGDSGDTGLGLAICKGIVEAHGGRIWAESDGPDLGSRFIFTIPVVEEALAAGAPGSARRRREGSERQRVLVVDDDPQTLRYVRDALTRAGYAPTVTGDPKEALRLVEEEHPRLVLLDLMLPGTDGIALMEEILQTVDVPVIFLSAYGQDQVIARAFESGATDYMVKPFSPTELVARIGAALRRRATPDRDLPAQPYVSGDLSVNYLERRVTLAGREVRLSVTEYDLLVELSLNAGLVLTHQHLVDRVWGQQSSGDAGLVRTVVQRLRRKLGDDADHPAYILTEPRVGYRMARAEDQREEPLPAY